MAHRLPSSSSSNRSHEWRGPTFYLIVLVALSTGASSSSPQSHFVDLSYQHYLGPDAIAKSVSDGLLRSNLADNERNDNKRVVEVDVSSSLLGDAGMAKLVEALIESKENERGSVRVKLSARMNKMTSSGASALFESLLLMGRQTEKQTSQSGTDTLEAEDGGTIREQGDVATAIQPFASPSSREETDSDATVKDAAAPPPLLTRYPYIEELDIGLNDLSSHHRASLSLAFARSLRKLIEGPTEGLDGRCPRVLRLDRCGLGPAACRALGKGILNAATVESKLDKGIDSPSIHGRRLSALHLSGNDSIGDAGAAALAAALRTAPRNGFGNDAKQGRSAILDVLDLSSCGVGDAGAEALAMAIRDNPGCVRNLDLSNNRISDEGANSIGRALASFTSGHVKKKAVTVVMESLDLSNNQEIGDKGASAIAEGLECGALRAVSIRSCSVRADGAFAFGKSLCALASSKLSDMDDPVCSIDLSGNQLGTLKVKKKKGAQYSASLLKSKASATTASYMNFIGKKIQSGLKDAGIGSFVPSDESDDDEDELMGESPDAEENDGKAGGRCGARSFSDAIVNDDGDDNNGGEAGEREGIKFAVAMRRCFLDEGAADALAGAIVRAKEKHNIDLAIDLTMNQALEKHVASALRLDQEEAGLMQTMARRHFAALEALRIARQRAAEAAAAAAARARAESVFDNVLGEEDYSDDFGVFREGEGDDYDGDFSNYDEDTF